MKLQGSTSKFQRSSNSQAPTRKRSRLRLKYSLPDSLAPRIAENSSATHTSRHAFDLEERTSRFGEAIVRFAKKIPRGPATDRLTDQLVGCGTSIGANYCEANEAVSKKDFRNTIGRCVKQAGETKYFLRLIAASEPQLASEARELYREAKELHLIFATMFRG
jgi:four helix bundle protein